MYVVTENGCHTERILMVKYVAVLDLETTGFSPEKNEITEVAIAFLNPRTLKKEKEYTTLVKIKESYIPKKVEMLTNITYAMTQEEGIPLEEVQEDLKELLDDCIVVAHNAPFDFSFVEKQLGIEIEKFFDTLSLSRILEPQVSSHKLGDRCEAHGIKLVNAHRAMNDVLATAELLKWQLNEIKNRGEKTTDYLNVLHRGKTGIKYYPKHTGNIRG